IQRRSALPSACPSKPAGSSDNAMNESLLPLSVNGAECRGRPLPPSTTRGASRVLAGPSGPREGELQLDLGAAGDRDRTALLAVVLVPGLDDVVAGRERRQLEAPAWVAHREPGMVAHADPALHPRVHVAGDRDHHLGPRRDRLEVLGPGQLRLVEAL